MLYLSATKGIPTSGLWRITTATHTIPSFCKLRIEHPFYKSSIKHPFGTTRNHGLDCTTANLLRPNFTNAKYSLPTNENQQFKLLFLTLEQQLPGRRAQSSIMKIYTENFGRNNNQFDQLVVPVVTIYSINRICAKSVNIRTIFSRYATIM